MPNKMIFRMAGAVLSLLFLLSPSTLLSQDWPMWRYDAGRGAATPAALPDQLHLNWVRELPEPRRAWRAQGDDMDKLEFDLSYQPVAAGGLLFVPCMVKDRVLAFDTSTGLEKWRFHADGPVRFAPVVWEDRLYFVSDDGGLYCLEADTGALLWRFAGVPSAQLVLGNERVINMWPARGGPVLDDGIIYFAAGIWPFMGVFIHAVDAESGRSIWTNSGSGSNYDLHQHGGAHAYGGVAPQGYLAVSGDKLLVAGGRTPPAVYDRLTGEFLYFRQASGIVGKGAGGYAVFARGDWFFNHGILYSLKDGAQFDAVPGAILSDEAFIGQTSRNLVGYRSELAEKQEEIKDRLGRRAIRSIYDLETLWQYPWADFAPDHRQLHLQAGTTLYAAGAEGKIAAIQLPTEDRPPERTWTGQVEGEVWSMLAADNKLFVVTLEGRIYCFGAEPVASPEFFAYETAAPQPSAVEPGGKAEAILNQAGLEEGYALFLGVGDGELLEQMAIRTRLHIVGVDPDREKIAALRQRFDRAGLYGGRVALIPGNLEDLQYPPYISSLIVVDPAALEQEPSPESLDKIYSLLRPYGGKAFLGAPSRDQEAFRAVLEQFAPTNGSVINGAGHFVLSRDGAIPETDNWTHQYADSANSVFSRDRQVRLPLGILWFGGPTNCDILPRHTTGPRPHVVDGRLIVMGVETISARDVYTGRVLWSREFPGIGHPFTNLELEERYRAGESVYMTNIPGATYIGSPYVTVSDSLYVQYGARLLRLDPVTGETLAEFKLPPDSETGESPQWGHISVRGDYLIATSDPHIFDDQPIGWPGNWNATSSKSLVVLNRYSGEVLWSRSAQIGFRHNAIVSAAEKVFIIDGLSPNAVELLARRGQAPESESRIMALDIHRGDLIWEMSSDIFGTWLSYSEEHDVLLEGGTWDSRRQLPDEPRERMSARRGVDGILLWDRAGRYDGPVALRGDEVIPGRPGTTRDLFTGEDKSRAHPFTGEDIPWTYARTYGCNTMNASQHLLLLRSGAAGFVDLENDSGTGNFGGFRSSCTANMIAANGVLNAPDYTRTCACSYQNQTSVALVHMPGVEIWTSNRLPRGNGTIQQAGLNLGAPGNRRAENGTLWIDYPRVGGPAPDLQVTLESENPRWFRKHSLLVNGPEAYNWVSASGVQGIQSLMLEPVPEGSSAEAFYTVHLFFSEPDAVDPGERVFHIHIQGRPAATDVDVVQSAGAANRGLKKVFARVPVANTLKIEFEPANGSKFPPILSGIEIIRE